MGVAPFFPFLFLLLPAAYSSRDVFMPMPNDAERNHLFMDDSIDLHDLVKVFENEVSSFKGSPTEFSHLCLEISRNVKEALNDQSLANEIDSLASTLCHIVTSDLEAKLRSNETCTTCRNTLDSISDMLGDTNHQLLIIVYLLRACEIQTIIDQCKRLVFAFGPLVITGIQMIVSKDLCYMLHICEDPRSQTQYVDLLHVGEVGPHPESKLDNMNLM